SHMGGVYERQIRTICSILSAVLDHSMKRFDTTSLRTLLYKVMLNNRLFEELAMDVYDEVDRRENDAGEGCPSSPIFFGPLSCKRIVYLWGRQKLARFNAREFATLIIDILSDAKRRQQGKGLSSPTDPLDLGIDDDEHDYDNVASDEDTDSELTTQNNNNTQRSNRAKVQHWKHVLIRLPEKSDKSYVLQFMLQYFFCQRRFCSLKLYPVDVSVDAIITSSGFEG
ncbi:hypothetical protein XENOCAPTIV_006092, partial [Xenoophorus captivus]